MNAKSDGRRNWVLAALPEPTYRACMERLEPVELGMKEVLFEQDAPIRAVHFPVTAVCSLVTEMADGSAVECATVGKEGMVGLPVFLGAGSLTMSAFAQVPGEALRMEAGAFCDLLADVAGPLQQALLRYTQSVFTELAQNVACNRLHSVEQRCAKWLLTTADRVDAPQFPLTHEFLAQMLGVRRASVTEVAGRLARDGAITYQRGVVEVLDRHRLAEASCECYDVIKTMLVRMLGSGDGASTASTKR